MSAADGERIRAELGWLSGQGWAAEWKVHDFDELAALQEEVWDCRLSWLAGVLHAMADPEQGSALVYCARDAGKVVGSGWIDFHHGSPFAQLRGGAVLAVTRG